MIVYCAVRMVESGLSHKKTDEMLEVSRNDRHGRGVDLTRENVLHEPKNLQ